MKKHKVGKIVLLVISAALVIFIVTIFLYFKNHYISGSVVGFTKENLIVELDDTTTFTYISDCPKVFLYVEDLNRYKEGEKIRAICRRFVALSDPPIVSAYWVF